MYYILVEWCIIHHPCGVLLPSLQQVLQEGIPFLKLRYTHLHLDSNQNRDKFDILAYRQDMEQNRKGEGGRSYNLGNTRTTSPNRIHTVHHSRS